MTSRKNIKYNDFINLIRSFGFVLRRSEGSHNFYKHEKYPISLNTQNKNGEAKPYQIEQFLKLVEKYGLTMKNPEED
jgi:hypothetical protein